MSIPGLDKIIAENMRLKQEIERLRGVLIEIKDTCKGNRHHHILRLVYATAKHAIEKATPSPSEPTVPDKAGWWWRNIRIIECKYDALMWIPVKVDEDLWWAGKDVGGKVHDDNLWGGRCKEPSEKGQP